MRLHVEKRLDTPKWLLVATPVASVLLALLLGGVLMALTGSDPFFVYKTMLLGTFGTSYALSETVVKSIPLMLTGLGVGVAMRMKLWNIGAEGQLLMGAFAATGVALFLPELPWYIMMPTMFLASFLAGGLWAVIAVLPRALWNINEIITTLMLNYVGALWIRYLVQGPWRDPQMVMYPFSAKFPPAAIFPKLGDTRIHLGLLIALVAAVVLMAVFSRTKWGYEIRVIGASVPAARYAGMRVKRNIIVTMLISGGLAGLAGMSELAGVFYRLQDFLAAGAGYTAIIIASLAGGHPLGTLVVAFLFGGLLVGGTSAQTVGVSAAIADMLQGAVLFFVIAGEFFRRYQVRLTSTVESAEQAPDARGAN